MSTGLRYAVKGSIRTFTDGRHEEHAMCGTKADSSAVLLNDEHRCTMKRRSIHGWSTQTWAAKLLFDWAAVAMPVTILAQDGQDGPAPGRSGVCRRADGAGDRDCGRQRIT